ncbi:hypothetical protein CYMTET_20999 [Cymbomonas tetramitiformis]|uniref:EGF-like domain-containing protein n=1 Tax=Cymbomonas tetramitiformis TaxID=36881 RepID=A0AAE0G3G2_9CHLO|nr:hypothetical protein CYMTET_20999 [Cymbomonas tetramitiformis]
MSCGTSCSCRDSAAILAKASKAEPAQSAITSCARASVAVAPSGSKEFNTFLASSSAHVAQRAASPVGPLGPGEVTSNVLHGYTVKLAEKFKSCADACADVGAQCVQSDFRALLSNLNPTDQIYNTLFSTAGETCGGVSYQYNGADHPVWVDNDLCYVPSDAADAQTTCDGVPSAATSGNDKRRLCFCTLSTSSPTTTLPPTTTPPTLLPTTSPTGGPSESTVNPSKGPTATPITVAPSTDAPSATPTKSPTTLPTTHPTASPTTSPTVSPSPPALPYLPPLPALPEMPTNVPTTAPTLTAPPPSPPTLHLPLHPPPPSPPPLPPLPPIPPPPSVSISQNSSGGVITAYSQATAARTCVRVTFNVGVQNITARTSSGPSNLTWAVQSTEICDSSVCTWDICGFSVGEYVIVGEIVFFASLGKPTTVVTGGVTILTAPPPPSPPPRSTAPSHPPPCPPLSLNAPCLTTSTVPPPPSTQVHLTLASPASLPSPGTVTVSGVLSAVSFSSLSISSFDSPSYNASFRSDFSAQMAAVAGVTTATVSISSIIGGSATVVSTVYFPSTASSTPQSFAAVLGSSPGSVFTYLNFSTFGNVTASSISISTSTQDHTSPLATASPRHATVASSPIIATLSRHCPSTSPVALPPPPPVATTATVHLVFEDLALSDLMTNPVAYDNFTAEFTSSVALHAGVETEYVSIDSLESGSVHVHSTIQWTEAHLARGASPDSFIAQATSDAASIFVESASLGTHSVTAAGPVMASGVVSVATVGFPAPPPSPPPMCEVLEPCFPGVLCGSDPAHPTGYLCGPCPEGMSGDGEDCTDVDECAVGLGAPTGASDNTTSPCDPLTQCTNEPGGFSCSGCPGGYTDSRSPDGVTVCLDIDECHTANGGCDFLTKCFNVLGARACGACPAGYTGEGETGCYDVDECGAPDRGGCAAQAECVNLIGGSSCGACEPAEAFNGDGYECRSVQTCEENNGGCDPHVECAQATEGSRPTCGPCPEGLSGTGATKCSEIDGCARAPCFDGVVCVDVPAPGVGAVCGECPEGFIGNGRSCEADLCAASPPPCSVAPSVACINLIGAGVTCGACPAGYTGDGSVCADVDECAVNNGGCHYLTECRNLAGGAPTCGACPEGYVGSGYTGCRVQVACGVDNGGCDPLVSCTDSTVEGGTPVCGTCPRGYTGDGIMGCEDIDGCEKSTCYPGVHCEDIPAPGEDEAHLGGYICGACPTNMVGDGTSCIENKCSYSYIAGGCDPMVSCTNDADAPDGFVCGACPVGFTDEHTGRDGTKCEDVDGCLDQPCAREKECFDVLGQDVAALGASHTCGPCPAGYLAVGELCEDVDECALANGGCWMTSDGSVKALCVNEPGGFSCGGCPAGLRGSGLTGCEPTTDCRENNGGCWVGTGADTGFAADCEQTEVYS